MTGILLTGILLTGTGIGHRRGQARKLMAGKFGERDFIFLPSMFLPFLPRPVIAFSRRLMTGILLTGTGIGRRRGQARKLVAGKFGERDFIFLPSMFLPFLPHPVIAFSRRLMTGILLTGTGIGRRSGQARKLVAGKFGERDFIFLPSMFLPFLPHPVIAFSRRFMTGILLTGTGIGHRRACVESRCRVR
jgi:hypothetical protein